MKLVDILARELKEWPDRALYAWQDWNLEIRFRHSMENDFFVDRKSCDHVRKKHGGNPTQGVTRSQWQAAVDALKAGEQAWDGEKLPPVGHKVIIGDHGGNETIARFSGREAVIIAHNTTNEGDPTAVFKAFDDDGMPIYHALVAGNGNFEKVRTAEQIAAEERNKAIGVMVDACSNPEWVTTYETCAAIYDAGYRKQEVQQ